MVGKLCLLSHVDATDAQPNDLDWVQCDFMVLTWLYGSIFDDILYFIMEPDQSARELWTHGEELFRDNMDA